MVGWILLVERNDHVLEGSEETPSHLRSLWVWVGVVASARDEDTELSLVWHTTEASGLRSR